MKEYIIKAGMDGLNHFEGVPIKIIVDYITMNLIDGLRLDTQFREPYDAHLFRLIVDRAVWKAKEQTKDGKWHDGS